MEAWCEGSTMLLNKGWTWPLAPLFSIVWFWMSYVASQPQGHQSYKTWLTCVLPMWNLLAQGSIHVSFPPAHTLCGREAHDADPGAKSKLTGSRMRLLTRQVHVYSLAGFSAYLCPSLSLGTLYRAVPLLWNSGLLLASQEVPSPSEVMENSSRTSMSNSG